MKVCSTPSEGFTSVTETPVLITNCTDPFTKSHADLALVLFDGGECLAGLRLHIDAGVKPVIPDEEWGLEVSESCLFVRVGSNARNSG